MSAGPWGPLLLRTLRGQNRYPRITTGTHALIQGKDGITLPRIGGFTRDGSYLATLYGGGVTLNVPVIEYHVTAAGRDAPELFA